LILVFRRCWIGTYQSIYSLSMHEIVSHQASEGERSFDGFLGCVGEAEQQVGDQRHGDLDANGVLGCADEVADPEGLLDPAEEQLDGPAALVEIGYFLGRSVDVIAQDTDHLACVDIHRHLAHRVSSGCRARD
jgi:hypothetical protein